MQEAVKPVANIPLPSRLEEDAPSLARSTRSAGTTPTTSTANEDSVALAVSKQSLSVHIPPFRIASNVQEGKQMSKQQLKEWVWKNYQDEIFKLITVTPIKDEEESEIDGAEKEEEEDWSHPSSVTTPSVVVPTRIDAAKAEEMRKRLDILEKVAHAQHQYLRAEGPAAVYTCLIDGIIELMHCDYGFVGEVKRDAEKNGALYLQCHGMSLRSSAGWSEDSLRLIRSHTGLRFYNLDSLWGTVLKTNQVTLTNDAQKDSVSGTPPGHPPLRNFLGIPIQNVEGELIGMIGIANNQKGFSEADLEYLKPFTDATSNVIQSYAQAEELRILVNTLEQRVEERTQSLRKANQYLEQANQRVQQASELRLQHFACMSHEIRTPLNCILGMSGLLLQEGDADKSLSPMQRESMQMIVASGDLLLTVVNDVLDYSKLETGNVDINPRLQNLQEMLNALIHSMEMKDHQQRVSIQTHLDPKVPEFVTMDSQRIQQILFNLLGNALKFSKVGGTIEFKVEVGTGALASRERGYVHTPAECAKQMLLLNPERSSFDASTSFAVDGSEFVGSQSHQLRGQEHCIGGEKMSEDHLSGKPAIRFTVKDYGKGIACKDFARIFAPFRQASAEVEQVFGGTGLGLAITGKLVHAMGGVIAVDSVEAEWTEFVVELPFHDVEFNVEMAQQELSSATVLLVDDDPCRMERLKSCVSQLGMPYREFESMELAEEFFTKRTTPVPQDQNYLMLINEAIYDDETYELLSNIANVCQITFGPKYSVRSSCHHIRSPCRVLPSVLWRSFKERLQSNRQRKSRTPSIASSVSAMNRYEFRILVAEDNTINQRVLHRMLSRMGVNDVTIVDDGQKALEACLREDFDLIFMDMQMPVMDGLESCRAIMASPEIQLKPKVVFATAHASEAFEAECAAAGGSNFHGFLPKPFTIQEIEFCLDTIVSSAWNNSASDGAWNDGTMGEY